jgi:hypothetical protein
MNINLENKPIGAGNISFQTGDAASFIFWIDKNEPAFQKLYELFFKPSIDRWVREDEMVVWDAGVMYSPSRNAFYFTEFCLIVKVFRLYLINFQPSQAYQNTTKEL